MAQSRFLVALLLTLPLAALVGFRQGAAEYQRNLTDSSTRSSVRPPAARIRGQGRARPAVLPVNSVQMQNAPEPLASEMIPAERLAAYGNLAVQWMQEYLRIDTTNPPGNEIRAAEFFKRIFDREGIQCRLFQYASGRADIWARVPATVRVSDGATGRERPIILLNHMDVVTSDPSHWQAPPFSGSIVADTMYGRGSQDMKGEAIAQLLVMVMLKREHPPINRDVIFLATADEEAKDTGTDWFIAHRRDLLGNAEFLITEGGQNVFQDGQVRSVGVDVAEKAPFWLHLVARGQPGHGSIPIADSAVNRLLRALRRINAYHPAPKVLPSVDQFFRAMAAIEPPARARQFLNFRAALQDTRFRESVEQDDSLSYMLHNTISITMLGGSKQINVIPDEAWANLDVRLLPGEDPRKFLETLRAIVADPNVTIEPLDGFVSANSSPTDTLLFAAIRRVAEHYFAGAPVLPRLTSGYTESQRYRSLGMVCYGFTPYTATPAEADTEHGDNERIRLQELRRGYRVLYDVVLQVAGASSGT